MGEKPTYRAGIIGCGRIASTIEDDVRKAPGFGLFPYTHAGVYQRHPRTELVAAADINESALSAFGERWGVTALYTDYREMLEREQLHIVSIAALSRLHHEMTMEVAKHPVKGIFLEKPVAHTLDEADEMIAACQSAGIKVAVNHTRTFDPYYRAAKALIDTGEIGKVRTVIASCAEGFSFGGSHLFDLLRYMIGAKTDWVVCYLEEDQSLIDPCGDALIVYENGVRVHVYNARSGGKLFSAFDFIGTEGRIRMGRYDFRWWQAQRTDGWLIAVERPFPGRHDGKSGMYTAVEELIHAMETGGETASNLEDGRTALEITVALLMSGQRGEVVKLPITDTSFVAEAMW